MNYLERQTLITNLANKISEYVVGDVNIQEVMSLDPGTWKKYCIQIENVKMNFKWKCIIEDEIDNWNANSFNEILEKYKSAVYKQFFFY